MPKSKKTRRIKGDSPSTPINAPSGGRGIIASNEPKMRGMGGPVEAYSAGHAVNNAKLATERMVLNWKMEQQKESLEKAAAVAAEENIRKSAAIAILDMAAAMVEANEFRKEAQEKTADVAKLRPLSENILITPEGKIVIRRSGQRRFDLPTDEMPDLKPVPYESAVQVLPPEGVKDPGFHGYNVSLRHGAAKEVPQGYEAADPEQLLNDMYASMGLAAYRPYMGLDRARARAIRRLTKKKPAVPTLPM